MTDALLRTSSQSSEWVICIIGPNKLHNELLSNYLEQNLGLQCFTAEDYDYFPMSKTSENISQSQLVLWDCERKDFLHLPKTNHTQKFSQSYATALFNVCPGLGIEEKYLQGGVRGFFYKNDSLNRILMGVRAIFEGELWVSRKIMTRCILQDTSQGSSPMLTRRQIEILTLAAKGMTNHGIAEELSISIHTVKTHLFNIFQIIDVSSRCQAAQWLAKNRRHV